MGEAITSADEALGASFVPVSAPWGDEGCEVAVCWMQGNTVISMPAVKCGLDFVWGNGGDNGPWRLSVMSLPRSMLVEGSVVNNSPGAAIKLGSNDHSAAPSHWVIDRDLLEDAQADITV